MNFGDSGPMAWHWEDTVKLRTADVRHCDRFPRAKQPSELEGSEGGIMADLASLLRFVVKISRTERFGFP